MNRKRATRKKEHLVLAAQGSECSFDYFSDIILPHDCLTQVNPGEVDLSSSICGHPVANPLYINAITGGALVTEAVNRRLATVAAKLKLPMAVGSQMSALKSPQLSFTYRVVRKHNPQGLIMANLSAAATPQQARMAVEMIDAQVLQLHLNPAQELIMPEGDLPPQHLLENIADICATLSIPVLVKEVGFGLGVTQARLLRHAGVRAVDVSGSGGTNFAIIEGRRNQSHWWKPLTHWGYPTPLCVADVAQHLPQVEVLASGGVTDGIKAIKSTILGASALGVAGPVLSRLLRAGQDGAEDYLRNFLLQMRSGLALMGLAEYRSLKKAPAYITGKLGELFTLRGIDPQEYARRGQ